LWTPVQQGVHLSMAEGIISVSKLSRINKTIKSYAGVCANESSFYVIVILKLIFICVTLKHRLKYHQIKIWLMLLN
jgi:hypothetical protein